jgi:hypothetical protein
LSSRLKKIRSRMHAMRFSPGDALKNSSRSKSAKRCLSRSPRRSPVSAFIWRRPAIRRSSQSPAAASVNSRNLGGIRHRPPPSARRSRWCSRPSRHSTGRCSPTHSLPARASKATCSFSRAGRQNCRHVYDVGVNPISFFILYVDGD